MILFGVGIIIIATGKLLQYVVYGLGQSSPATTGDDRGEPIFLYHIYSSHEILWKFSFSKSDCVWESTSVENHKLKLALAVNPCAELTGTGEPPLVQVQMSEIVASASSGGTDETTTDLVAAASAPAANSDVQNRGVQVEVVIEAPPRSSSHQTDVQYILANVFTTTYHLVAEYVFNSFASGDGTFC
jgi:hypothetical protein